MATDQEQILWQEDAQSSGISCHASVATADTLPPLHLTRAVCAYAFNNHHQLLLTKHPDANRGWDIPGGHIELKETVVEALKREFIEETNAIIEPLKVIAWLTFEVLSPKPPHYKYSYPLSYTPIFLARVVQVNDFQPHQDAIDRGLFVVADIPTLVANEGWLTQQSALTHYAVKKFKEIA